MNESRKQRNARRQGEFPPAPEPLAVPVFDSHTHLDITVQEPGVPGGDPVEALAAEPRVRGIGETGLDTFRTGEEGRAAQELSFRAHIAIAKRYAKPLIIHDRDAHDDVLRVLDSEGAPEVVVLHCFSGDATFAAECVRRGYLLSFAGTVTFANAGNLRSAAAITSYEQMLVETDAPYLTPVPYRGRPNASYLIPVTVRALAETAGADLDTLCAAISATGERVFGPWR